MICATDVHDLVAQLFHGDEPLIHQAEDQLGLTAPAGGVAVLVVLRAVQQPLLRQVLCDWLSDIGDASCP